MSVRTGWWIAREAARTLAALRLSRAELRALADRRLAETLRAAAGAPFYRERLAAAGFETFKSGGETLAREILATLPPVGKQELREAGTAALVGGRVAPEWFSSTSSGSTGEPFRVYFDPRAWAILKFLVKLRSRIANGMRVTDRVAVFDAIPVESQGTLPLERLGRLCRISVLQPGSAMAERVARFEPRAAYGLPSALLEAAGALAAAGRSLRIPLIFTGGEVLLEGVRRALADAYGARVLDTYGTSETKEIAWECLEGGMHLNADVVHVEVLGPDGARLPEGVEGDLVVTSLVNHAMPLIRYRTTDRGALAAGTCRCGLEAPLFGLMTGREAEMLDLGGKRLSPYVLTSALEKVEGLVRYQIRQVEATRLMVRTVAHAGLDLERVSSGIRQALGAAVHDPLRVDVEFVDQLEAGPGGKYRVVQPLSTIASDEA